MSSDHDCSTGSKDVNTSPEFVVELFKEGKTYKDLKKFDCGDPVINGYAKDNLKRDGVRENKKIYVLLDPTRDERFVGFVSAHLHFTGKHMLPAEAFPHPLPKIVPVVKISMIAVAKEYQRTKDGWGSELLSIALDYAIDVALLSGEVKAIVLDAKEDAVGFYLRHRFTLVDAIPDENGTYFMSLSIRDLLAINAKRKQLEESAAS
ncbi:N-acetyltransferase [Rahnella contaminans]|uniref:N-acetyltransferase n=1 Tax=Rahnella contaminans TaxID=2703882 RepID=UPI003C2D2AEA